MMQRGGARKYASKYLFISFPDYVGWLFRCTMDSDPPIGWRFRLDSLPYIPNRQGRFLDGFVQLGWMWGLEPAGRRVEMGFGIGHDRHILP